MALLSDVAKSKVMTSLKSNPSRSQLLKIFRAALATCWYGLYLDIENEDALRLAVYEKTREIIELSTEFVSTLDHSESQRDTTARNTKESSGAKSQVEQNLPMTRRRFSHLLAKAMVCK